MMGSKNELIELIQQLPEEKFPEAVAMLKKLVEVSKGEQSPQSGEGSSDSLQDLMAIIVYSITNTLYDLSVDAGRNKEKVMANRLETYRKKVSEAWEIYINKMA